MAFSAADDLNFCLAQWRCLPAISTQRCFQSTAATDTRPFTQAEDDRILEMRREKIPMAVAAVELGRTTSKIQNRLHNVLLVGGPWPEAAKPFSKDDDERILHMMREVKTAKLIATDLRRSTASTRSRMNVLLHFGGSPPGMRRHKPYNSAEDNRIMELRRQKTPMSHIAQELGRSVASVRSRWTNALSIVDRPAADRLNPYNTFDDDEILGMWQAGTKVAGIAKALGRSVSSVRYRLHKVILDGGPRPVARKLSSPDSKRQYPVEEFDRIAALMAAGHSARSVADMLHMRFGTFRDLWRRVQARSTAQRDPSHRYCTQADKTHIIQLRTERKLTYVQIAHETGWGVKHVGQIVRSSLGHNASSRRNKVAYSTEEDEQLIEYRERHGMKFAQIPTRMTRSASSLYTRYTYFLKDRKGTSTKLVLWTEAEDQILQDLLKEGNLSHDEIAARLPRRTVKAVRTRVQWKRQQAEGASTEIGGTTPEEAKVASSAG
ncbi:hypothetical protein LTR56_017551 [Elasticomyces elasticus]|nr:hypothetical protein LTR22_022411 [Elasticomyces elasticus]KAK3630263.1 hypothetical protein LTR56_017551 [Elasticomyces elasticus]KAK4913899.1 hypothetical protein LTR49_017825 [Elasticomyces elasticus]KAK5766360.1 hypothetical protein LTS12_003572 [Elasticomyces elasticus]